ncbi:unnamed protein product, partial [Ceratitis capitata]
ATQLLMSLTKVSQSAQSYTVAAHERPLIFWLRSNQRTARGMDVNSSKKHKNREYREAGNKSGVKTSTPFLSGHI